MRTCRLCGRTASCGCAFNSEGICKICAAQAQGASEKDVPLDIRLELSIPSLELEEPAPNRSVSAGFGQR